jgi:hypothetical protein
MQVNRRHLREKVTDLKNNLNDPRTEHTAKSSQLNKSTTNCFILSTKLDEAAAVQKELGLLADRMDATSNELKLSKAEIALIYGWLIVVTQKYGTTNHIYNEAKMHLSEYLKQLKVDLDCRRGTKAQLARAASKLIVALVEVVDSAMEVYEAHNQLF